MIEKIQLESVQLQLQCSSKSIVMESCKVVLVAMDTEVKAVAVEAPIVVSEGYDTVY